MRLFLSLASGNGQEFESSKERREGGRKKGERKSGREIGRKGRREGRPGTSLRELLGGKPQAHFHQVLKPKASASSSALFSEALSFVALATGNHVRM